MPNPSTLAAAEEYTGPSHYFASCALSWATADTEREAIEKCYRHSGFSQKDINRLQREGQPGLYIWTCRVLADSSAQYSIAWYMPQDIDIDTQRHHHVTHSSRDSVAVFTHKGDI